jgi:hypothetical protein
VREKLRTRRRSAEKRKRRRKRKWRQVMKNVLTRKVSILLEFNIEKWNLM